MIVAAMVDPGFGLKTNEVQVLGPHYCFDGKVDLGSDIPYVLAVEK